MSLFGKGDRVKNIRTGELGYVVGILPPHRGVQMYKVKYDDRVHKGSGTLCCEIISNIASI